MDSGESSVFTLMEDNIMRSASSRAGSFTDMERKQIMKEELRSATSKMMSLSTHKT